MKRFISILLILGLLLGVTACGHTHEFGNWEESKAATCTEKGEQLRKCNCGEIEFREVPADGHSFGEWEMVVEPTCTENGKRERKCLVCGLSETEVVLATGHSFVPATAFAAKHCKKCGITEGEPLAILIEQGMEVSQDNHKFGVIDIIYKSKITECESPGFYNSVEASSGNILLAVKINFTNLGTTDIEDFGYGGRIGDIQLQYADKYSYSGDFRALAGDILALGTKIAYIVYEVPVVVKDGTESIKATFEIDGITYAMIIRGE